jgi:hypothetical protein
MEDNQNTNRQENLDLIATALQTQLAKDFIDKTALYEEKFVEIFDNLSEIQELLLLSVEESKKASINLSQLEIDSKIAKSLQEFGISKDEEEEREKSNLWMYVFVAVIFLAGFLIMNK